MVSPAPSARFIAARSGEAVRAEDGDRLDRLLDEGDRAEHRQPCRDHGLRAQAEDRDGADHRRRRPGEERAPEARDVEHQPRRARLERMQRERRPEPRLDRRLGDEGGGAEHPHDRARPRRPRR